MEKTLRLLNRKYLLFLGSMVVAIVVGLTIVLYNIKERDRDTHLVNIAGRQRMLYQQISKCAVMLLDDRHTSLPLRDTLRMLSAKFRSSHNYLKGESGRQNVRRLDSLFVLNEYNVNLICSTVDEILSSNGNVSPYSAVTNLLSLEIPFIRTMEGTVSEFQHNSERRLRQLKDIAIFTSVSVMLLLILEFSYFFLPANKRMESVISKLIDVNRDLAGANNELRAREDELKRSLMQVTSLTSSLEASERQYKEIIDGATDIIYELNDSGCFNYVNDTLLHLTGYSRDQLIGTRIPSLVHEDDRDSVTKTYEKEIDNRVESSYHEFRLKNVNGNEFWVGQNVRFIYKNDKLSVVRVVARNITALKEVRDKLERSEALYRLISENSSDVISVADENQVIRFISRASIDVLGYTPEEMIGRHGMDSIDLADLPELKSYGIKLRSGDSDVVTNTFRVKHKRGNIVILESTSRKFIGAHGEKMVQSSLKDITSRYDAEVKLEASERRYKLLSENTKDLVSLFTPEGKYIYVSPSSRSMLGYEPEELIGTSGLELVHPDDASYLSEDRDQRISNGYQAKLQPVRVRRKDGTYVWIEALSTHVLGDDGKILYIQTSSRDVTERKYFEQALIESMQKAEQATKAKSQFLSMMSHEIRTPMNAIVGFTSLLLSKESDPDKLQKLQMMRNSCNQLLTIINDILDFSKIEADKVAIEQIDFSLRDVVFNIVDSLRPQGENRGVKIDCSYDDTLPDHFLGDAVRIGQVITNLVNNSIKFTLNGEVRVRVSKLVDRGDSDDVAIEVVDTGIGIPEEKIETIFESFTQAEDSTTRNFGGTGLGLAITKKLVTLMGGTIGVQSKVGAGSRFFVHLNLRYGIATTATSGGPVLPTDFIGRNIHILIVEDNEVNQIVAAEHLENWGFKVTISSNGPDALKAVSAQSFDLVLMDLQMPGMSGYEVSTTIRQMKGERFKVMPIIALTASVTGNVKLKARGSGMNDYVSKPFKAEELLEVILKHVSVEKLNDSSALALSLEKHSRGKKDLRERLVRSAIHNMEELISTFDKANDTRQPALFTAVVHKCKMTIAFLQDEALTSVVKEAEQKLKANASIDESFRSNFYTAVNRMIELLKNQLQD
jgi:PAS domain S-box-containing protein